MGEVFRVHETSVVGGGFSFSAWVSSPSKGSSNHRRSETRQHLRGGSLRGQVRLAVLTQVEPLRHSQA